MDGASNDWIARRCCQIIAAVQPHLMLIQWSYTHRRELPLHNVDQEIDQRWRRFYQDIRAPHWPESQSFQLFDRLPPEIQTEIRQDPYWLTLITADDHNRRLDNPGRDAIINDDLNTENFFENVHRVEAAKRSTRIVHTFIPRFTADTQRMHEMLQQQMPGEWLPEIRQQDFARDGHHYDIVTATCLVDDIINIIS
jgi:hypothetical protein